MFAFGNLKKIKCRIAEKMFASGGVKKNCKFIQRVEEKV